MRRLFVILAAWTMTVQPAAFAYQAVADTGAGVAADLANPALVLTTSDDIRVYTLDGRSAQLKERRTSIHPGPDEALDTQPLEEMPDRSRLLAAYLDSLLDCGAGVQQATMERWIRQQTASGDQTARRLGDLVLLPLKHGMVIVAKQAGNHAVVLRRKTGSRLAGSPCGAANRFYRVSPDRQRLALVSENVRAIDFTVSTDAITWDQKGSGAMAVQVYDLGVSDKPLLSAGGDEEPLDVYLPDQGNWRLLSARNGTNWFNPLNWVAVIGGHAERRSDVFLKTYDASGMVLAVDKIAAGIGVVQARFVATAPAPQQER